MKASAIIDAVTAVTKDWAKIRKSEERDRSLTWRRRERLIRPARETIKDVAWEIMPAAYAKASANGTLPAQSRQIMYAARREIQARTGRTLDGQYFTQTLVPDYIAEHAAAAAWNVVFDARGHFAEPHTKRIVPLGTLDVRRYLHDIAEHAVSSPSLQLDEADGHYPTCGPQRRFGAILFIEKEGFMPLFDAVQLAERYDIAIMSTKGLSVTASRELVDQLCGDLEDHPVPLLMLHDFDKAGFSILATLQRDTRRFEFTNDVRVVDLGLRLQDVQAHQLPAEMVSYGRSDPTANLQANGATAEEIAFLCSTSDGRGFSGQRVELNAFASDQLVAWIEAKLVEHGVTKVVPRQKDLVVAYRRAVALKWLRARTADLVEEAETFAKRVNLPKGLHETVTQRLRTAPAGAWDHVVADLARDAVEAQA